MICFDLLETLLFNVGIDSFSIGVVLIVYRSCRHSFADTQDIRLLRKTEVFVMFTLASDIVMWLLDGRPGTLMRVLIYADNIAYFCLQLIVAFEWLRYAYIRIFRRVMEARIEVLCIIVPFAVMSIFIFTSPFNGLCFYVDAANRYHRGVLSAPLAVITLVYLISSSVMAQIRRQKETLLDRKKELRAISLFAVLPFLGGAAQTVLYGCSLLWPCVVLAILLIYINKENQAISQDYLTGMNNRGNLDRFLQSYTASDPTRAFAVVMADVNHFKEINDLFGHGTGDTALIQTANILRATFSNTSAFLSRYGGDEFVIVLPGGGRESAEAFLQKIRDAFAEFNRENSLPYQLSLSMGYSVSSPEQPKQVYELLEESDRNMYCDKRKNHMTR